MAPLAEGRRQRPLSYDEAHAYLDGLADGLPPGIARELNGGIILSPDTLASAREPGLYTLGLYHYDPYGLGRYIEIFYGSFLRVHGHADIRDQRAALKEVLYHELTHHLESLAGVRDLEVQDQRFLENYRNSIKNKKGDKGD